MFEHGSALHLLCAASARAGDHFLRAVILTMSGKVLQLHDHLALRASDVLMVHRGFGIEGGPQEAEGHHILAPHWTTAAAAVSHVLGDALPAELVTTRADHRLRVDRAES